MKFLYSSLFIVSFLVSGIAQVTATKKTSFTFQRQAVVNYSSTQPDYSPKLLLREMPKQRSEKMEIYNYPANYKTGQVNAAAAILPTLSIGQNFVANPWGLSTPNDNDMAISNSGMLISVINTNIFVRNTVTNVNSPIKSLAAFTTPINSLHQEFDPKVMYDPLKDRFVLVCLVGFVDTTSKIIVGFSQTNDPSGAWNLYSVPGNPLNNSLWSDYPMISMTDKELFLTVNLLYNNQPWQTGFNETLIWQMKKDSGYAGLPLGSVLHSNIKFNNKPIRNLCPVKGGSQLYSPNMYFISNRNLASQNDTVFLVNVTDTIGAPTGTVTTKALISSQPYSLPVDGRQTNTVQTLATNDCRNLGAFYENGLIQYVHNTNHPVNNRPTIYYGTINNPAAVSPTVTGYIIFNDTMDFAYPNISYAGNSATDNTSIFTFNHSSNKVFGGTSAIRADALGDFSPVLRIQNGTTYVNMLAATQERWGDYSGSQRRYNDPGKVWMSGYNMYFYSGSYPFAHRAWVTELGLSPFIVTGIKQEEKTTPVTANVFPNPAKDIFSVELSLAQPEYLSFELYDQQGKLITTLLRDWVKVTQNTFTFSTQALSKGIYLLKIKGNYNTAITKKVVVE